MKLVYLIVTMSIFIVAAGCSQQKPAVNTSDENIPKIIIIAKRFTTEQKRVYDEEVKRLNIDLVQR